MHVYLKLPTTSPISTSPTILIVLPRLPIPIPLFLPSSALRLYIHISLSRSQHFSLHSLFPLMMIPQIYPYDDSYQSKKTNVERRKCADLNDISNQDLPLHTLLYKSYDFGEEIKATDLKI
jgi:hypothetical protein